MNHIKVGVAVIIIKDKKILLGKRINSIGHNTWAPPGGKMNYKETIENCAKRETLEETGIHINNVKKSTFTNDLFENDHYVSCFVTAEYDNGNLELKEPDKCSEWKWFNLNDLPQPLFTPLTNLIKNGSFFFYVTKNFNI